MKNVLRIIIILIVVCGFISLAFLGAYTDAKNANKHWNNGICEVCGGAYKFKGATYVRNHGDRYYYSCEDCDHTIMTYSLKK